MLTSLAFTAKVSPHGYEWIPADKWFTPGIAEEPPNWRVTSWNVQGDNTPRLLLREVNYRKQFDDPREVQPTSQDSSLFRNFASIEPTLDAIACFANEHGLLLGEDSGDPFAEWESEIRAMRFLIDVWDRVRTGKMSPFIADNFTPNAKFFIACPHTDAFMQYFGYRHWAPQAVNLVSPWRIDGKPFPVAKTFIVDAINRRLAASVNQVVLRAAEANSLAIKPVNLLSAMWMQFAASISGEQSFDQCEECSRYMEIGLPRHRSDRKFCSNKCRNRALRQRQKRAIEMQSNGKTVKTIAAELDSDAATVKKWLAPKKGK